MHVLAFLGLVLCVFGLGMWIGMLSLRVQALSRSDATSIDSRADRVLRTGGQICVTVGLILAMYGAFFLQFGNVSESSGSTAVDGRTRG